MSTSKIAVAALIGGAVGFAIVLGVIALKPKPSGAAPETPAPAAEAPPAPVRADVQPDVEVHLVRSSVGHVQYIDRGGTGHTFDADPVLVVTISLANRTQAKKFDYRSWGEDHEGVTLADEFKNRYRSVTFGRGSRVISPTPPGVVGMDTSLTGVIALRPGVRELDVLVFQAPLANSAKLTLRLPRRNFGESGAVTLNLVRDEKGQWSEAR